MTDINYEEYLSNDLAYCRRMASELTDSTDPLKTTRMMWSKRANAIEREITSAIQQRQDLSDLRRIAGNYGVTRSVCGRYVVKGYVCPWCSSGDPTGPHGHCNAKQHQDGPNAQE